MCTFGIRTIIISVRCVCERKKNVHMYLHHVKETHAVQKTAHYAFYSSTHGPLTSINSQHRNYGVLCWVFGCLVVMSRALGVFGGFVFFLHHFRCTAELLHTRHTKLVQLI